MARKTKKIEETNKKAKDGDEFYDWLTENNIVITGEQNGKFIK